MFEVREMLRLWLLEYAIRAIARMVRCDRKTVTGLRHLLHPAPWAAPVPTVADRPSRHRSHDPVPSWPSRSHGHAKKGSAEAFVAPVGRAAVVVRHHAVKCPRVVIEHQRHEPTITFPHRQRSHGALLGVQ